MFGIFGSPALEFRPLAVGDAEACALLHAASFQRPWAGLDFERFAVEPQVVGDVMHLAGRVSGFALSRIAVDEAEILSIAVEAGRRGAGLGRHLLTHHRAALAARGVRRLFLEVDEENAPAIALYRRVGFLEVGRRPAYYPRPDGSHAAAAVMRLDAL